MSTLQTELFLKNILRIVAQQGASDLHLGAGRYPTLRIDGELFPLSQEHYLTPNDTKFISDFLLSEKQKEILLDRGSVDLSYNFEDKARFRVNVFLQKSYVSIAFRYISEKIPTLSDLSLPENLYKFCSYKQGFVLVTGPVGHGKTTTLAALLDYINHNRSTHIITIEDPIEYVFPQDRCIINQREVGSDAKDFNRALISMFRQDANVVFIGELRDLETISTAMTAAETGHLVFATLHTNDAAQTIDRIVDVFPAYQQNQIRLQLASVLSGVISQRLLPKISSGRTVAVEVMIKNTAIENLIRENKSYQIDTVIQTHFKDGMVTLDQSLSELVNKNIVKYDDALLYAKNTDEFTRMTHNINT